MPCSASSTPTALPATPAWDGELGRSILDGSTDLAALHERAFDLGEPTRVSGGQERLENLVARHIARTR